MASSSSFWSSKNNKKTNEKIKALNRHNQFNFFRFGSSKNTAKNVVIPSNDNQQLPKIKQVENDYYNRVKDIVMPKNVHNTVTEYMNLLIKTGIDFNTKKPIPITVNNEISMKYQDLNNQIKLVDSYNSIEDDQNVINKVRIEMNENVNKATFQSDIFPEEKEMDIEIDNNLRIENLIQARKHMISNEDRLNVRNVFNRYPNNDVVILKFKIDITAKKIQCLKPSVWLNDEVINFYMCMLQERDTKLSALNPNHITSHYFNSFFISKLLEGETYNYGYIKRWSKSFDVFKKNKIFMPINIRNTHWTMAIVFVLKKEIHYYDSMSGNGQKYLDAISRWLVDEAREKKGFVLDISEWQLFHQEEDVPQQHNFFDCGVFSIMCADYISDDLPINSYNQSEMPDNRIKITASILRGELLY